MSVIEELLQRFDAGNKRAIARLISIVEDRKPEAQQLLDRLYAKVGQAARIGITGPPGAGKSTLVDRVVETLVDQGEKLAVVAVDPTSPFTGGALLGDRVRMGRAVNHDRVFFRSLASRGSLGGLSLQTSEVADVLDAAGYDQVLLETVGVGQSELDIADKAHSTVVVLVPESGDGIQAMKAGLMEIADLYVVNKADRAGARRLAEEIGATLDLKHWDGWRPPVLLTQAKDSQGIEEVIAKLAEHRAYIREHGILRQRQLRALESRVRDLVQHRFMQEVWNSAALEQLQRGLTEIESGSTTPYRLARQILASSRQRLSSPE